MKALVLAAGEGNSLEDLTLRKPKPLISVAGVLLVCRVVEEPEACWNN